MFTKLLEKWERKNLQRDTCSSSLFMTRRREFETPLMRPTQTLQLSTFVWRHERWESDISNLHIFSR